MSADVGVDGTLEVFDWPPVGMGFVMTNGIRAYVKEIDEDTEIATCVTQFHQEIRMRIRVIDAP